MQIKSPSKRVSQLDLKFLDLKFLVLKSQAKTLPVAQTNHKKHSSILTSKGTIKNQKSINQTADITLPYGRSDGDTHDFNQTSVLQSHASDVLDYLGTNLETIRNKCTIHYQQQQNSRLYPQRSLDQLESKDVLNRGKIVEKKKKKVQKEKTEIDRAINFQIQKYQKKINKIENQNTCIHKQIAKLYFENQFQLKNRVKNVKGFKIREDGEDSGYTNRIKKLNNQGRKQNIDFSNYISDLQKQVNTNNKVGDQITPITENIRHKYEKNSKSKQFDFSKDNKKGLTLPKLKHFGAKSIQTDSCLPYKQKYQKFYQDLSQKKHSQPNEQLENLRKKMINNNIDKGFQAFLNERKMRIPQFFKKLR